MSNKQLVFTSAQAARLLKVTPKTIAEWINAGFIDPVRRGERGADRHLMDEDGLFALCCGRACRRRGLVLRQARAVAQWIAEKGLEYIKRETLAGRRFLVVIVDEPCGRLLGAEEIAAGTFRQMLEVVSEGWKPCVAVDVQECLGSFAMGVAELMLEREKKAVAARSGT